MDSRSAGNSVQSFIAQHQTIRPDFGLEVPTTTPSPHAPDFEDVSEVRCKPYAQRHRECLHSIIDEFQFLVRHLVPEKLRTKYVQCPPVNGDSIALRDVKIRQVRSEKKIVRLNCRAQE